MAGGKNLIVVGFFGRYAVGGKKLISVIEFGVLENHEPHYWNG